MSATNVHRLDGLEPDNLLAFLALIGVLRALNQTDGKPRPRVSWTVDEPPLRPRLHLAMAITSHDLTTQIARGLNGLTDCHDFNGRKKLDYSPDECRALLSTAALSASAADHAHSDLLSSLMTDAAIKDTKSEIDPTPLCLMFGSGQQYFMTRLANVRTQPAPERSNGKARITVSAEECLSEALFRSWHRNDPKNVNAFRWDPQEDVRYAMMAGDPTDNFYKSGTQHGANRLAAVGLAALTLVPEFRVKRVRPSIVGGSHNAEGFSFAWPIWREPTSLAAVIAMLTHPELRAAKALQHLGVEHVMLAHRISVAENFMNFTRARPIS